MAIDNQLQEKGSQLLVAMIDTTIKGMSDVIDFGKQQIPEVIHQLLMWKVAEASIYLLAAIFIIIVSTVLGKKSFSKKWMTESEGESAFVAMLCIVVGVICFYQIISHALIIVNILIAPKVYLIMFAKELIS